jgi:hypothetical protein
MQLAQVSSEQAHGAPPAHPPPIGIADGGARPPPHDEHPAWVMFVSAPLMIDWA